MDQKKVAPDRWLVFGFVALMVVALAGYAVYVDSAKEETSSLGIIGTLPVEVTPMPSSAGTETVAITYDAPGQWDFSGWDIKADGVVVHTLTATSVSSG